MDRTLVNLVSIILGGAGLFTVLTGFNVPETTRSFWGDNPFAIKRDAVQEAMDWIFSGVALLALLFQLAAEVAGERLPPRLHGGEFYVFAAGAIFIAVALLVFLLSRVGRRFARRSWVPRVIGPQADLFDRAAFVLEHDGWTEEQVPHIAEYDPITHEDMKARNRREAERHLAQVERLFEIPRQNTPTARVGGIRRIIYRIPIPPSDPEL